MLLFRSEEHARNCYERQGMSLGAMMTLEQQWQGQASREPCLGRRRGASRVC